MRLIRTIERRTGEIFEGKTKGDASRFIRTIERRTGEIFEGKTKGDASRFISQWKDEM